MLSMIPQRSPFGSCSLILILGHTFSREREKEKDVFSLIQQPEVKHFINALHAIFCFRQLLSSSAFRQLMKDESQMLIQTLYMSFTEFGKVSDSCEF
jgi:hypothetical protein